MARTTVAANAGLLTFAVVVVLLSATNPAFAAWIGSKLSAIDLFNIGMEW